MVNNTTRGWQVLGESVQGASHLAHAVPNQDAIRWWQSASGLPLILAVADGHGSARSFRSQFGAQIAVDTAVDVLRSFLDDQADDDTLSAIKHMAEDRLPRELVRTWKDRIEAHIGQAPFSTDELERLSQIGAAAYQAVVANHLLAYGATMMSALVAEPYIVYLQLGDGDILTVSTQGEVSRPFPKDGRFLANETTSLCMPDAIQEVQVGFVATIAESPALILLCTDGYGNSFRDDENFLKVGSDLFEIIRGEGLPAVRTDLNAWLNQASQSGSGDDITLGVVCRLAAFETA